MFSLFLEFRYVAVDLPGHGLSSHRPPGVLYSFPYYVMDVRRVIDGDSTPMMLLISSHNILNPVDGLWNLLPQLCSGINSPLSVTVWVSAALHRKPCLGLKFNSSFARVCVCMFFRWPCCWNGNTSLAVFLMLYSVLSTICVLLPHSSALCIQRWLMRSYSWTLMDSYQQIPYINSPLHLKKKKKKSFVPCFCITSFNLVFYENMAVSYSVWQ